MSKMQRFVFVAALFALAALNMPGEAGAAGFIRSRHLDDKAGVACLFGAVKALLDAGLAPAQPTTLHFSHYEEVGHGAAAGQGQVGRRIRPVHFEFVEACRAALRPADDQTHDARLLRRKLDGRDQGIVRPVRRDVRRSVGESLFRDFALFGRGRASSKGDVGEAIVIR